MANFVQMYHTTVVHVYNIQPATYYTQDAVGAGRHPAYQGSAFLAHRGV